MSSLFYLFSTLFFIVSSSHFSLVQGSKLHGFGVNYGTLGDNLPVPKESVRLIRKLNVGSVKIYDANSTILSALAGTGILVSIMVPNEIIPTIAANQSAADTWIISNVLPHYKSTKIKFLLVGNEILSDYSMKDSTWPVLVPAMKRLHRSLQTYKISNIKISTTLATDAISLSFRAPSSGSFRPDISSSVILPFLNFLNKTKSYYFVDAYPYFTWSQNYSTIPLNYALFQADPSSYYTDPITKSAYTNLLDETLDSVIFAMQKLGFCDVKLGIAETGWPNGGDLDQIGMNVYNAATYNRNLVKRMAQKLGTPARPGVSMPVFIFSLFNENKKGGPGTERHWGMYYPDEKPVYEIDLSAERPLDSYKPLPIPHNNVPYQGPIWCVLIVGEVSEIKIQEAINYACEQGNNTCDSVQKGGLCYEPNSLASHANWIFNSYWQQFRKTGGTCYFNGLAVQTAKDPSFGSCKYPSSLN